MWRISTHCSPPAVISLRAPSRKLCCQTTCSVSGQFCLLSNPSLLLVSALGFLTRSRPSEPFQRGPEQGPECLSTVWCVGPRLVRHSEAISFCTSAEESRSKGDVSEHSRLIRCSQRQLPELEAFAKTYEKLHSGGVPPGVCH